MSFLPPFNIVQEQPAKRTSNTATRPPFSIAPAPAPLQSNGTPAPSTNVFAQQQPSPGYPTPPPHHIPTTQYPPQNSAPLYTQFAADPASSRPVPKLQPFSASTQEILKSIGTSQHVDTGTPEWEAARERVLKSMARSVEAAGASPAGSESVMASKRGRGRGRPSNLARAGLNGVAASAGAAEGEVATPVKRGRGGRPRGSRAGRSGSTRGGRGGKRKRAGSEDGDELSSLSPTPSPTSQTATPSQPTITKSGRNITKPTPYTPLPPPTASPNSNPHRRSYNSLPRGSHRRRGTAARSPSQALCAKCSRGHSPASNVIVFCDDCNTPWHQWCHDPHIGKEVVEVAEKEWLCGECAGRREDERVPMETRVGAETLGLSEEEREQYLELLPGVTLRRLLVKATRWHPTLPAFAPNARELLRNPAGVGNDPYPDIAASALSNDPPSTYPRPGHGPIPPKPVTDAEDVEWLLEAEGTGGAQNGNGSAAGDVEVDGEAVKGYDGFSHYYDDGSGELGLVPVVGDANGTGGEKRERTKGAWIQRGATGTDAGAEVA